MVPQLDDGAAFSLILIHLAAARENGNKQATTHESCTVGARIGHLTYWGTLLWLARSVCVDLGQACLPTASPPCCCHNFAAPSVPSFLIGSWDLSTYYWPNNGIPHCYASGLLMAHIKDNNRRAVLSLLQLRYHCKDGLTGLYFISVIQHWQ